MLSNLILLAVAFQVGPFYQQREDYAALRPLWSQERDTTDVIWPVFTSHRDWWRFCLFVHYQDYADRGYQFEIMPLWWNGRQRKLDGEDESYCGLFPIAGYHPHILLMHDIKFVLWPLWMQYTMPRREKKDENNIGSVRMMKTNAVLFPFFHWRDDGSWGFWPFYGVNQQRESDHRTCLWPIVTWASYRDDRDTAGKGYSWMFWPIYGSVNRERERQMMFVPPVFSYDATPNGWRLRCPWPVVDVERRSNRDRTSVFPLYERSVIKGYAEGEIKSTVTRFGWKLIEIYDSETRVFPFWVSRPDGSFFRLWPFYESRTERIGSGRDCKVASVEYSRFLSLFPIKWVDSIDRNWAKFWTFYESESWPTRTYHSLLWGIIRWSTEND